MVTEAGFGADIGMEKFFNIKVRTYMGTSKVLITRTLMHASSRRRASCLTPRTVGLDEDPRHTIEPVYSREYRSILDNR